MNLYHFSHDPTIAEFVPRPVQVPSRRAPGMEWLNGPLVWAVDAWHAPTYFFPRDCPRILLWRTLASTPEHCLRHTHFTRTRPITTWFGVTLFKRNPINENTRPLSQGKG
jgi:hypothetical protein